MAHIVILGAGIGGLPMAYEMRGLARTGDRATVVSDSAKFHFVPSDPWVAVDWRRRDQIEVELAPVRKRRNIEFTAVGARRVHPAENRVGLGERSSLGYDYLVVATGPKLAFDEVPGLGPLAGHAHSICHADRAVQPKPSWKSFVVLPQIPPRNVNGFSEGKWLHLSKVAFEKYVLRKLRAGTSEPLFEKMVLKALDIMKLNV
jgi:sulfide:quinone oxidoreductase